MARARSAGAPVARKRLRLAPKDCRADVSRNLGNLFRNLGDER